MPRKRRIAAYVTIGVLVGLILAVVAVLVLTRTEFGVERVGRYTVRLVDDRIAGDVAVQRVTSRGGLLGGVTLHGVVIDEAGRRPFLTADSLRLSYDWRTFVSGRVIFDAIALYNADVVIEKLPGDTAWNYERVFADPTPTPSTGDRGGRLVLVGGIKVRDSELTLRMAFEPDEPIEVEDTARFIMERVAGGLVRVMRFEDVEAEVPRILWESPYEEGQLFEVTSLDMRGYIWEEPALVRDLRGMFTLRDSLLSFDIDRFRLPASTGSAVGKIALAGDESVDVIIRGRDVALDDLQWLLPTIPEEGRGSMNIRIQSLDPDHTLWHFSEADIRAPDTRLQGTVGFVFGDSLYFTTVNLRADPLNLELLKRLIPGDLPLEGLSVGSAEITG